MRGFAVDTGALIALERRSFPMLRLLREALAARVELVIPRTVIAQVWRGGPGQANVSRLLNATSREGPVIVDELTAERAKRIGLTIGRSGHPDIVDVHVSVAAREYGHAVLTSDDDDIRRVDPNLVLVHV